MESVLHAIEPIHLNLIVIGLISSCCGALIPGLLFATLFLILTFMGFEERANWDRASVLTLLESLDHARDELRTAEGRFVALAESPSASEARELQDVVTRTVNQLSTAVFMERTKHLRRPLWVKQLPSIVLIPPAFLLFFLLGGTVALLVSQAR
jgi:hypothetical protein